MEHFYAVIMAGGGGTRLWPLSRKQHPKQALALFGERTLYQLALDRLHGLLPLEQIFVVTAAEQVDILSAQAPELPRENFIVEPEGRGTAACIGLAAVHLRQRDPEAVMAVLTADHFIRRVDVFQQVLVAAAEAARQGFLVTLGIEPSYPATGYGYINRGEALEPVGDFPLYQVERFAEKPDGPTALEFLLAGTYYWNSGMFIWQVSRILEEFARWMPELNTTLSTLGATLGTADYAPALGRLWPQLVKETIDYGIMERAARVAVIPVDLGWSDVGGWRAVMELHDQDAQGNVSVGTHLAVDTENTMVFARGERLVATIGVRDLIVVDTPGAVLITTVEQSERVREVVRRLEQEAGEAYL